MAGLRVTNPPGDSKVAAVVLKIERSVRTAKARHNDTTGIPRNIQNSNDLLASLCGVIEYVGRACEDTIPAHSTLDHDFMNPLKYAESLLILARDVDAHPWGAFAINHPSKYLPFLQQLAGDLMTH